MSWTNHEPARQRAWVLRTATRAPAETGRARAVRGCHVQRSPRPPPPSRGRRRGRERAGAARNGETARRKTGVPSGQLLANRPALGTGASQEERTKTGAERVGIEAAFDLAVHDDRDGARFFGNDNRD